MRISVNDIEALKQGVPPDNFELIENMTVGREMWLDFMESHYLSSFIKSGGSKVKVVVGKEGTGKTHLLKNLEADANKQGYQTVYISLKEKSFKLNDLTGLYKAIVSRIDKERMFKGLCQRVAAGLGYSEDQYDGAERLLPRMVEEGLGRALAEKEFRTAVGKAFRNADFGPSFTAFAFTIVKDRMLNGSSEVSEAAWRWFKGERMERRERIALSFYEQLQRSNARYWLNSLIRMLRLSGIKGLIVLIDDCEILTSKEADSPKYYYTPNQVKDACEMIRQLIDDFELLGNCLFVFAGDETIIEDDRRGFRSYEALWMRIRSGLVPVERFNRLSDMVDTDLLMLSLGEDAPAKVSKALLECLAAAGYERKFRDDITEKLSTQGIKRAVQENAWMAFHKDGVS